MDTRLLTISEVMGQLHLGRTATYSLIKSRRLASVKVGGARRVPVVALDPVMRRSMVQIPESAPIEKYCSAGNISDFSHTLTFPI